jgi:adenosylcobinamide-GDP ribazoletransferase
MAFLFSFYCYGNIKGFTGDTLGAQCEITEISALLAGALIL